MAMPMIAERIYKGETAYDIGIPDIQFASRKDVVDRFVAQWDGEDFKASYLAWLPTQSEGGADDHLTTEMPAMPSIATRARNLSGAFKRVIKSIQEGTLPKTDKEEAQRRFDICESNECGYFDGSVCRHINCGCFSKIKTFFETESCPIEKW